MFSLAVVQEDLMTQDGDGGGRGTAARCHHATCSLAVVGIANRVYPHVAGSADSPSEQPSTLCGTCS